MKGFNYRLISKMLDCSRNILRRNRCQHLLLFLILFQLHTFSVFIEFYYFFIYLVSFTQLANVLTMVTTFPAVISVPDWKKIS